MSRLLPRRVSSPWRLTAAVLTGVAVALSAAVVGGGPAGAGQGDPDDGVSRVLLVSLPGLTWDHVAEHDLPNIEAFLEGAAMANSAPRGARVQALPGGAYLTISAGARAIGASAADGQELALDNTAAGSAAGEIFARRTGVTAEEGAHVALAWPSLLRRNDAEPYDAELGLLGDTLREAGMGSAAIGNADGADTKTGSYQRQVGLAAVDSDGVIASGHLEGDLNVPAPEEPFGVRQDADQVVERFQEEWPAPGGKDGGLVVVEQSDLARTMRYHSEVSGARYDELWADALADADSLFGRLLAEVDPARDAVLLLAPYNLPEDPDLTVAALRPPASGGSEASSGLLRSSSTQRSGYVTLVDVAPTILDQLGVDRPGEMEGRPMEVVPSDSSVAERVDKMVSANEASRFRENLLVPTTVVIVVLLAAVAAAAIVQLAGDHGQRWLRKLTEAGALLALTLVPMSFVARGFPLQDLGLGFYWGFLLVSSIVIVLAALVAGAVLGRPRVPLALILAVAIAVIGGDVVTGSRLHMSAALGYSPTDNARLYGISNYALGVFGAAMCVAAGLMVSRPERWARWAGVGMLMVALMVIGAPMWGANVGGIISFAPVVVLFAGLLFGARWRRRTLFLALGAASVAAVSFFAAIDLARPASERAHLGRLMERLSDDGLGPLWSVVERKGVAALEVSLTSFWTASAVIGIVLLVFVVRGPGRRLADLERQLPGLRAGITAACGAAVFGSIVNDSGTIVAGTAMLVVVTTLVVLLLASRPADPPHARRTNDAPGTVEVTASAPSG